MDRPNPLGFFTELLARYRIARAPITVSLVASAVVLPHVIYGVVADYLAIDMARFSALLLAPRGVYDPQTFDIVQRGHNPAIKLPETLSAISYVMTTTKELDNLNSLPLRTKCAASAMTVLTKIFTDILIWRYEILISETTKV